MDQFLNVDTFINNYITGRSVSFFKRDLQDYHTVLSNEIRSKSVLVIGGAGTIGSSFIKAVLRFKPAALTVVDHNENGLTELTRDLRSSKDTVLPEMYVTYPMDFGGALFKKLFQKNHFDIIACFAAHKHVRSEKDPLAIEAMIRNNVFNTKYLLELALTKRPNHFFSVSTDKAANPVNVMGASKKIMEKVLLSYADELKITTARFANVAFSNGSLPYGFLQRIMKRQPLSSPMDVRRYFISPEESGHLCLLAAITGVSKDIFFPKLDEDQLMTFSSIAENFLKELGAEPYFCSSEHEAKIKAANWEPNSGKYPVYFSKSDTSGEKLFEEFYTVKDEVDFDSYNSLGVIKNTKPLPLEEIDEMIKQFESIFDIAETKKSDIISLINCYLPDFKHIETGKSLDLKM